METFNHLLISTEGECFNPSFKKQFIEYCVIVIYIVKEILHKLFIYK